MRESTYKGFGGGWRSIDFSRGFSNRAVRTGCSTAATRWNCGFKEPVRPEISISPSVPKPVGDDDAVLAILQEVGAADIGDWSTFRVSEATTDLDGAPYGGARYPVEAMMAGRTFVKFHLDVGIGDVIVDPVDTFQARDWLGRRGREFDHVPPGHNLSGNCRNGNDQQERASHLPHDRQEARPAL